MNGIIDRILKKLGDADLVQKLIAMPKSDFNSFLLYIFQNRLIGEKPRDIINTLSANNFSSPSEIDFIKYHCLEGELLAMAKAVDINPVLLSPAAPLGSCSVFGCVNQNNVVSATRGLEILADPTNMLSIIIAKRIKNNELDTAPYINYCTTSRVLRTQQFSNTKGYSPHFGIFSIVSSGIDSGSYICERDLLIKHISFFNKLLSEKYGNALSICLRKRKGYTDSDGFLSCMTDCIKNEFPKISISFDLDHEDNNYYKGINYKLYIEKNNEIIEIGDGGFVDWIQLMTNNKKERCLISGIGLDRLLLICNES